jgi:hypothetical protein
LSKKIIIILLILFLFNNTHAFAGDIPESIMNGNQKALFIGKVSKIALENYFIIPSTIMMGSIEGKEIKVNIFESYYGNNSKPKVGDYVVAILIEDNKVDESWIFKASSDNYKNLKLKSINYNMVMRYQKYINEGKYFEAQKKIDEKAKLTVDSRNVKAESIPLNQSDNKDIYKIITLVESVK